MKTIQQIAQLALLAAGVGFLAGCLAPSVAPTGGAAPTVQTPGPAASTVAGAPSDIPTAAPTDVGSAITSTSSGNLSGSLVSMGTTPTVRPPLVTTGGVAPTVTLADAGRTIEMQVGDRFLLNLEEGAAWVVAIADPQVLRAAVDTAVPSESQGLFEAARPGATRLVAVNEPACRKAKPPCMLPTRSFEVDVAVK